LPPEVDPKLIERFDRNLSVMDGLIGDALRFARGTNEAPQEVDLHSYLDEIVGGIDDAVRVQWRGNGPAKRSIAVGSLRRVLQNLLSNARQHGSGCPEVIVDSGSAVEIHVMDGGPGIPADSRDAVFQPFFRLDRSRSLTTGGSGLGLAIVQQLCQAHGWLIEIRDRTGGGTDAVLTVCR
jgi:two-component system, OmpR family, osmolarity sensor histidine kinase EnvZ